MFGVGGQEVLLVLFVAFVVLGPKRLPEVGRALGRASRLLGDSLAEFRTAWEREASCDLPVAKHRDLRVAESSGGLRPPAP